jgi:hypothetical protein
MNDIQKYIQKYFEQKLILLFPRILLLLTFSLYSVECLAQHIFIEEFNTTMLDTNLWWTPPGNVRPTIMNGHLVLISDSTKRTKSELQSRRFFKYGELKIVAYSSNWTSRPGSRRTDTSIGYEFFGRNGLHHAILSTNGVLGVLHLEENRQLPCPPEITDQWFYSISSWGSIRHDTLTFDFVWKPDSIFLFVYGKSETGFAREVNKCHIPDDNLAIRLNCNVLLDAAGGFIPAANDTLWIDRIEAITDMPMSVKDKKIIPTASMLEQNFPNPFNPTTRIRYFLPEARHVVLKVFNVFGEEIRTLIDHVQPAGKHVVVWNGRGKEDQHLPSGVYFCRLASNHFQQTIKMLLVQ